MTRFVRVALVVVVLAMLLPAAVPSGQEPQRPRFRTGTDSVSVYATVVDETGRLVPGLTRDDFEVYDNGVRQDLTIFEDVVQPVTIVVMIDRSSSVEKLFGVVRDAAAAFVGHMLPADRARIGSFSGSVRIDPESFTGDRRVLHYILTNKLQDAGPTPLWNATLAAIDALSGEPGRRVVLIFSDGQDSSSPLASNATFGDVRARVETDDVMLYGIGLAIKCPPAPGDASALRLNVDQARGRPPGRGGILRPPILIPPPRIPRMPPPSPPFPRPTGTKEKEEDPVPCRATTPDPGLRELAGLGGGGYFELSKADDLLSTFGRVADELHHQYLLAFPASAADGKVHQIEVRLRSPTLTVRARRSYLAPVK